MKKIAIVVTILVLPVIALAVTGSVKDINKPTNSSEVMVSAEGNNLFSRVKRQYKKWSGFLVGMQAVTPIEQDELGRIDDETEVSKQINKSNTVKQ